MGSGGEDRSSLLARLGGLAALAALAGAAALVACASGSPPRVHGTRPELTPPDELCGDDELAGDDFCLPAERVEALLRNGDPEILFASFTESGVSRPYKLYLGFEEPDGTHVVLEAKWKRAPWMGGGFNNEPRKEIAAYEVQSLFLEADEYVVPPTVGRCMPRAWHEPLGASDATFPDTDCVFGVFAYWLENVTPDGARDMKRFEEDEAYARSLASLNLLTYLIGHGDSRGANFLVSTDVDRPRVFAIDNGLAFGGFRNPFQMLVGDWSQLHVPRLQRGHIERLEKVTRGDLDRLAVVAQYEVRDALLVEVPPTAPLDPEQGVRVRDGIVQLGLTRDEIDAIDARLQELTGRTKAGQIQLF